MSSKVEKENSLILAQIFQVQTKPNFPDKIQAYGAGNFETIFISLIDISGFVEGWVTSSLLYMQYLNTIVGRLYNELQFDQLAPI